LLQYAKARFDAVPGNPPFEVVEPNPPPLEELAVRAVGILKNPLFRKIQEIFLARVHSLLDESPSQSSGLLGLHAHFGESAETVDESKVLPHLSDTSVLARARDREVRT
jgi:hypothetical protein